MIVAFLLGVMGEFAIKVSPFGGEYGGGLWERRIRLADGVV